MLKKFLYGILLLTAVITFGVTYSFADDNQTMLQNATNGVRNMVGGAENGIENAARGISNTSKDVTGDMENGANNDTGTDMNTTNNSTTGTMMNTDQSNYSATRTSTTADNSIFGMNSTTWIWLIMAFVAVAIIALVYFYSVGLSNRNHYDDGNE